MQPNPSFLLSIDQREHLMHLPPIIMYRFHESDPNEFLCLDETELCSDQSLQDIDCLHCHDFVRPSLDHFGVCVAILRQDQLTELISGDFLLSMSVSNEK